MPWKGSGLFLPASRLTVRDLATLGITILPEIRRQYAARRQKTLFQEVSQELKAIIAEAFAYPSDVLRATWPWEISQTTQSPHTADFFGNLSRLLYTDSGDSLPDRGRPIRSCAANSYLPNAYRLYSRSTSVESARTIRASSVASVGSLSSYQPSLPSTDPSGPPTRESSLPPAGHASPCHASSSQSSFNETESLICFLRHESELDGDAPPPAEPRSEALLHSFMSAILSLLYTSTSPPPTAYALVLDPIHWWFRSDRLLLSTVNDGCINAAVKTTTGAIATLSLPPLVVLEAKAATGEDAVPPQHAAELLATVLARVEYWVAREGFVCAEHAPGCVKCAVALMPPVWKTAHGAVMSNTTLVLTKFECGDDYLRWILDADKRRSQEPSEVHEREEPGLDEEILDESGEEETPMVMMERSRAWELARGEERAEAAAVAAGLLREVHCAWEEVVMGLTVRGAEGENVEMKVEEEISGGARRRAPAKTVESIDATMVKRRKATHLSQEAVAAAGA